MKHIQEFIDQRQKSWCIHCGRWLAELETNRDHVPSEGLLADPYPANLPVIEVCRSCNECFSTDEEYVIAFLGAVLTGASDPDRQSNLRAAAILQRIPKLRAQIERARTFYETQAGGMRTVWKPEQDRVECVMVKNARGHVYYEIGEPLLSDPSHVCFAPIETLTADERQRFEKVEFGSVWPELGSRMMTRIRTGCDLVDRWVVVQEGIYRYAASTSDNVLVRIVLFEYLVAEVCWLDA